MDDNVLKKLYNEYFQEKMKSSERYQDLFNEAVDYEKEYLENVSKEDKAIIENIVDKFIIAEEQKIEDTFINTIKCVYKVFQEINN